MYKDLEQENSRLKAELAQARSIALDALANMASMTKQLNEITRASDDNLRLAIAVRRMVELLERENAMLRSSARSRASDFLN